MSNIFGALGLADNDRVFNATVGQRAIYDVAAQYIATQNAALDAAMAVFVGETTWEHKRKYKLPGGGRLQKMGFNPRAVPGAVKAYGEWNVAFPLSDNQAAVSGDRVSMAYMTAQELTRHMNSVIVQNVNSVRFDALYALFNNTERTVDDPLWGDLLIEPLANGDSVTYPPVIGSETEATDNLYLYSGYAASAISDTNDPVVTIVDKLENHFGALTGGSEYVIFCNNAESTRWRNLTNFVDWTDRFITPGSQTATVLTPPAVPGKILGRHTKGAWIVEWRWVPSAYLLTVHPGMPGPLIKRVDPPDTGLPVGLTMVAKDEEFPFETSYWSHRYGFGCGNRLNGCVMQLTSGGSYSIPSAYQ